MGERVMVSACLLGVSCRYDGKDSKTSLPLNTDDQIVPICPEGLAGFGVPRPAIEWTGDQRVCVKETGADVTQALRSACGELAQLAKRHNVSRALLKRRSPSCGTAHIWTDGQLVQGEGMLAPYLREVGVRVERAAR